MKTNRVEILAEIDGGLPHTSTVSILELGDLFRHEQHWKNWAAIWHLDAQMDVLGTYVVFSRKPKGF